jgi:hypothetical protein
MHDLLLRAVVFVHRRHGAPPLADAVKIAATAAVVTRPVPY